jgi:hypothetical protein
MDSSTGVLGPPELGHTGEEARTGSQFLEVDVSVVSFSPRALSY